MRMVKVAGVRVLLWAPNSSSSSSSQASSSRSFVVLCRWHGTDRSPSTTTSPADTTLRWVHAHVGSFLHPHYLHHDHDAHPSASPAFIRITRITHITRIIRIAHHSSRLYRIFWLWWVCRQPQRVARTTNSAVTEPRVGGTESSVTHAPCAHSNARAQRESRAWPIWRGCCGREKTATISELMNSLAT